MIFMPQHKYQHGGPWLPFSPFCQYCKQRSLEHLGKWYINAFFQNIYPYTIRAFAIPTIYEMEPFFNKMKIDSCSYRNSDIYIMFAICLTLSSTLMCCHGNRNENYSDCELVSALFHSSSIKRQPKSQVIFS